MIMLHLVTLAYIAPGHDSPVPNFGLMHAMTSLIGSKVVPTAYPSTLLHTGIVKHLYNLLNHLNASNLYATILLDLLSLPQTMVTLTSSF